MSPISLAHDHYILTIIQSSWKKIARGQVDAPWKPYVAPMPKNARPDMPFQQVAHGNGDVYPEFRWNNPFPRTASPVLFKFQLPEAQPPTPPALSPLRRCFSRLFSRNRAAASLGCNIRPLLLPQFSNSRHILPLSRQDTLVGEVVGKEYNTDKHEEGSVDLEPRGVISKVKTWFLGILGLKAKSVKEGPGGVEVMV